MNTADISAQSNEFVVALLDASNAHDYLKAAAEIEHLPEASQLLLLSESLGQVLGIIGGLNSIKIDIPDWVPGVGGEDLRPHHPTHPHAR